MKWSMIIKTKHNIGDEVWTEYYTIPAKMMIVSITFEKDAEMEVIKYLLVNPIDDREFCEVLEEELFPTKEELLKSL